MKIYTEEEYKKQVESKWCWFGMFCIICLMLFGSVVIFSTYNDTTFFVTECLVDHNGSVFSMDSKYSGFTECYPGEPWCDLYCETYNGTIINYYDMSYTINATR